MPVHMPSTLGTRRGLMPHIDEACRVHTHDVVQHTPATQRGPALPSRHPQIYRQTRTFLERTGSLGGADMPRGCSQRGANLRRDANPGSLWTSLDVTPLLVLLRVRQGTSQQ
jgi:hypothetical protein